MRFDHNERKRELFDDWLQERIDGDILTTISRRENRFIRAGYERGLQDAEKFLASRDISGPLDAADLQTAMTLPVHDQAVEDLYARNFSNWKHITDEMTDQIGSELAEGLGAGENPNKIARRITDRVDKIGKTRATTFARTEIINSHATATLNRYDNMGITGIRVKAEWSTAGDDRVCPICINLEGKVWTIEEARTETITLTEDDVAGSVPEGRSASSFTGEFPVKPPSHPRCRCALLPEVAG